MENFGQKFIKKLRRSKEKTLISKIEKGNIPEHVAIVMDGNGRWAKRRRLPRIAGHRAGSEAIRRIVEFAPEIGIKVLTLYTFSSENWKRPKNEVDKLMKLFEETLNDELPELHEKGVRIIVLGDLSNLPDSTRIAFEKATELTKNNKTLTVCTALNYGGRQELVQALFKIARDVKNGKTDVQKINQEMINEYLYTAGLPDPELLIRTSGEFRISNFLLWQIAYTEIYFTPILWPDFGRVDLLNAIYEFQNRRRRYGGLDTD